MTFEQLDRKVMAYFATQGQEPEEAAMDDVIKIKWWPPGQGNALDLECNLAKKNLADLVAKYDTPEGSATVEVSLTLFRELYEKRQKQKEFAETFLDVYLLLTFRHGNDWRYWPKEKIVRVIDEMLAENPGEQVGKWLYGKRAK